uniref:Conserved plasma membrane protein n=1 Tax=Steinernema glaseri TaxID=37863 RepID=A0A1I7ZJC6_9BILA
MTKNYSKRLWERVKYTLRSPRHRIVPMVTALVVSYIAGYSALVYLVKGSEHPMNRFTWRLRKARGTLPEDLLYKERVVDEYFKSRVLNAADRTDRFRDFN